MMVFHHIGSVTKPWTFWKLISSVQLFDIVSSHQIGSVTKPWICWNPISSVQLFAFMTVPHIGAVKNPWTFWNPISSVHLFDDMTFHHIGFILRNIFLFVFLRFSSYVLSSISLEYARTHSTGIRSKAFHWNTLESISLEYTRKHSTGIRLNVEAYTVEVIYRSGHHGRNWKANCGYQVPTRLPMSPFW